MSITHEISEVQRLRPYADVTTADLVETLKEQHGEGLPYDDLIVAEISTRALLAEDPHCLDRRF